MNDLLQKLEAIHIRFVEVGKLIVDPDIIADMKRYAKLMKEYKARNPDVPTKSGLMVGLGEDKDELFRVLDDLREYDVNMLTVGQYLAPSTSHLPVDRFVHPDEFQAYEDYAYSIGFTHVASGPLVRSSYHADKQARGAVVK